MSAIPENFDSPFPSSNVILITEDAEGNKRSLHANNGLLSTFSSFFERMFFSDFKEANDDSVKVSCSYEIVKLTLEIIYGLSRGEFVLNETCEIPVLMELYKTGDYLDFPLIRNLCTKQMLDRPSVEMATAVLRLANELPALLDILMDIMKKMSSDDIWKFLSVGDTGQVFSKADVKIVYELISKKPLPSAENQLETWHCTAPLCDLLKRVDNEENLVDSTQKWPGSDLLIKTKNSDGKELFLCKTVLAMVSPHFAKLFLGRLNSEDSTEFYEIELDVEYSVMKNILAIIHHCYNFGVLYNFDWGQLMLNYLIFRAVSEERLDIPKIRTLFLKGLPVTPKDLRNPISMEPHLDVSVILNIDQAKARILENIRPKDLLEWVHSSGKKIREDYIIEDDKYVVDFVNKDESILAIRDVRRVVEKLLKYYNK